MFPPNIKKEVVPWQVELKNNIEINPYMSYVISEMGMQVVGRKLTRMTGSLWEDQHVK